MRSLPRERPKDRRQDADACSALLPRLPYGVRRDPGRNRRRHHHRLLQPGLPRRGHRRHLLRQHRRIDQRPLWEMPALIVA